MFKRVLAVVDSNLVLNIYRFLLKKYPRCQVVTALNGREALIVLGDDNKFDLILLDVDMPPMNGVQFLKHIRDRELYSEIPIILISTEGAEEEILRGSNLGVKANISKPFRSVHFYQLIGEILGWKVAQGKVDHIWEKNY